MEYHLGCDYKLDKDGTLVAQPTKYINKILDSFKKIFPNEKIINVRSPIEKIDHPELDNSELCNEEQIIKYMSMVGQLQWAITLGRYDILAQVMFMSRFSTQNWTFGKNEKIMWIACKDQTLCHKIQDQRT